MSKAKAGDLIRYIMDTNHQLTNREFVVAYRLKDKNQTGFTSNAIRTLNGLIFKDGEYEVLQSPHFQSIWKL